MKPELKIPVLTFTKFHYQYSTQRVKWTEQILLIAILCVFPYFSCTITKCIPVESMYSLKPENSVTCHKMGKKLKTYEPCSATTFIFTCC